MCTIVVFDAKKSTVPTANSAFEPPQPCSEVFANAFPHHPSCIAVIYIVTAIVCARRKVVISSAPGMGWFGCFISACFWNSTRFCNFLVVAVVMVAVLAMAGFVPFHRISLCLFGGRVGNPQGEQSTVCMRALGSGT